MISIFYEYAAIGESPKSQRKIAEEMTLVQALDIDIKLIPAGKAYHDSDGSVFNEK